MRKAASSWTRQSTRSGTWICRRRRWRTSGRSNAQGVHPGDITEEIIARVTQKHLPQYAMAQVTLDGLSREHGKGIDTKDLAGVREQLLDLKIRVKSEAEDSPVPLQQDIRMIDYLQEFEGFIGQEAALRKAEGVRPHPRARMCCSP